MLGVSVLFGSAASADRFQSTNYTIDAGVAGNSLGGTQSSTNYRLVSSGGESVIGNASGGSYKLGEGYVAQLEKSLQLTVQPANQVLYWPMDEANGTTTWDMSSGAHAVSLVGGPTWTTGKVGGALQFDGSTQYGTAGSSSPTGTTFTVSAWLRSSQGAQTMFAVQKSNNFGIGINFGKAFFYSWVGGVTCESSVVVSDGTWHHVVATLVDGTTNGSKIYVDGVESNACTWSPQSQTDPLVLGASKIITGYGSYFEGSIDEVKVFSRAFSAEEVKAEYDAQNAGIPSGVAFAGGVNAGFSKTSGFDTVVQTDAPDYTLAINQNNNLTKGSDVIPAVSGSIASPVTWTEGTTKGLGFTLFGTNATAIPGTWGSGNNYAALPGTSTTFYTRNNYTAGAKDYLNMRLRLDVSSAQPPGVYTNQMTVTGTMIP